MGPRIKLDVFCQIVIKGLILVKIKQFIVLIMRTYVIGIAGQV